MATYIQGVTDYIPQFQPFQPDLNFYANIMQTKQSQYDNNWKALNKVYGQYFYADLTRDNNIKKKEDLLAQMEFNLKRVSGLDLSLEQNVQQASQVFKPFYEDKNLMKDMAWTKTYNREVGRANSLKGSSKEDDRKQYWDTGLKAMNYQKDEFKDASDSDAMSFGNVSYTPYVNATEKAMKLAKEAGLSIESVKFTDDQRWIITQKNGEQLKEPLEKLFESVLGSDPMIQDVYQTQSYVNRKDYSYSNAAEFGGDKNKAEMKYLENSFNILKQQKQAYYRNLKDTQSSYDNRIKSLENDIANKKAPVNAEKTLENLKAARDINGSVLTRVEKESAMFSNNSSTGSTSTGFTNPYADVATLRYKVDAGMASTLMQKDFEEAAQIFSNRDAKTSIKENPYKVLEIKHANEMQQVHAAGSYKVRAASIGANSRVQAANIKAAADKQRQIDEFKLKSGNYIMKEVPVTDASGRQMTDAQGNPVVTTEIVQNPNQKVQSKTLPGAIQATDPKQVNFIDFQKNYMKTQFQKAGGEKMLEESAQVLKSIDKYISPDDLAKIINPDYNLMKSKATSAEDYLKQRSIFNSSKKGFFSTVYDQFQKPVIKDTRGGPAGVNDVVDGFNKNGVEYLSNLSKKYGDTYVTGFAKRLDAYLNSGAVEASEIDVARNKIKPYLKPIVDYGLAEKAHVDWEKKSNAQIANVLKEANLGRGKSIVTTDKNGNVFSDYETFKSYNPSLGVETQEYGGLSFSRDRGVSGYSRSGEVPKENTTWTKYQETIINARQSGKIDAPPAAVALYNQSNNLAVNGTNYITANQTGFGGQGRNFYDDVVRSVNSLDWEGNKNVLTYGGMTQTAINEAGKIETQKKLFSIFTDFNNEFNNLGKAQPGVEVGGTVFAAGDPNKVGNYIKIPTEFLDKYYNKADPSKGYLSKAEYDGLVQNGLSMIANQGDLSNSLIEGSYSSPAETALNYFKELEYKDPIGGHTLRFEVPEMNKTGKGGYIYKNTLNVFDEASGGYVEYTGWESTVTNGSDLDQIRTDTEKNWEMLNQQNTNIKYGLE